MGFCRAVISRVISPLIWVINIVTLLITLLIPIGPKGVPLWDYLIEF